MAEEHPSDRVLHRLAEELHDRFGIEHTTLQIEQSNSEFPCLATSKHSV
jgi:Co/Zn/Cd efflux system component